MITLKRARCAGSHIQQGIGNDEIMETTGRVFIGERLNAAGAPQLNSGLHTKHVGDTTE